MIYDDIITIINSLPLILVYMVQGYLFISIFNFIMFKKNDLDHLFFKSVVASYVLKTLFDFSLSLFPKLQFGQNKYTLALFVLSSILGYFLGLICRSHWFNDVLLFCGIGRTVNTNVWCDVTKPNMWVMYYCKSRELVYYGQLKYCSENTDEPVIALVNYQVMDLDGTIKEDNSADSSQLVLLNTKDFERIEITYDDLKKATANSEENNSRVNSSCETADGNGSETPIQDAITDVDVNKPS